MTGTGTATGEALAATARTFIGTPFGHQGRMPGFELDCAGVVVCAMEAVGLDVRDCRNYRTHPDDGHLGGLLERHFGPPRALPATGDVALMLATDMRGVPQPGHAIHCGIVDGSDIIHVEHGGQVVAQPDWQLRSRIVAHYGVR